MRYLLFFAVSFTIGGYLFLSNSCTKKITNIHPPALEIDTTFYPGLWQDYVDNEFPTENSWSTNPNTNRNIIIEDFTGHKCIFCPNAAVLAEQIYDAHPDRVFIASIHASPTGMGDFQQVDAPDYPVDFTCSEGLELGAWFGTNDGGFSGNPRGTISRVTNSGNVFQQLATWENLANTVINDNVVKATLQAKLNYYDETKGGYLHVEVEQIDLGITSDLYLVGYVIEDSLVGDQKMPDNTHNHTYVHRDIMRKTIDGRAFGTKLTAPVDKNGKKYYYMNYSIAVPNQLDGVFNASNMHVLLYVYNADTKEIYQVIEKHFE